MTLSRENVTSGNTLVRKDFYENIMCSKSEEAGFTPCQGSSCRGVQCYYSLRHRPAMSLGVTPISNTFRRIGMVLLLKRERLVLVSPLSNTTGSTTSVGVRWTWATENPVLRPVTTTTLLSFPKVYSGLRHSIVVNITVVNHTPTDIICHYSTKLSSPVIPLLRIPRRRYFKILLDKNQFLW